MTKNTQIRGELRNWFEDRADSERQIYHKGCYGGLQDLLDRFRVRLFIKDPRGQLVMDLGCGTGVHTISLASLGAGHVVSADLSVNALKNLWEYARELGFDEKIDLVCCDVLVLPFVENQFNQILLMSVLNHVPIDNNRRKAVLEVYRVLKPKGTLFVEIPMLSPRRGIIKRFTEFGSREKWKDFGDHIVYNFSFVDEDIDELFQSPSVEIVRISGSEGGGLRGIMGISRNLTRRKMMPRWLMTAVTILQKFLINQALLERYWRAKRITIRKLAS